MSFLPGQYLHRLAAFAFFTVTILAGGTALSQKPGQPLSKAEGIAVTAIPIDLDRDNPGRRDFGKLVFRGGLNLFGKSPHFGGYSALAIDPSGTSILAISDAGTWLRAKLDYDGRRLKRLGDAIVGPILGKDGEPLLADRQRDAEGMILIEGDTENGSAYVSFERNHRIDRFPFTHASFGPPEGSLRVPKEAAQMDLNRGVEAITLIRAGRRKGTLVAFSERLPDKSGNLRGWLVGGPTPGPIAVKTTGGFDITDIAALPDGGLVLLERRFRMSEGLKTRIRKFGARDLRPGAVLDGDVLFEASDAYNIDNFEGIAAHRAANGETILTLISDDNFNPLQRTLLIQFALSNEEEGLEAKPASLP